ncbi:hypothetical protein HUA76_35895 [Myxococcus sp. CA056]|uniref:hypothetical protein n=1 Tax=Myxococcus sp. CA056 TaxID=2741740 RepID=UPI00157A7A41|nr:hypothetical protein [Myxococcus sp. CA056]NTX16167.1 hypothetical protein [Myxococcus sp. CA056]
MTNPAWTQALSGLVVNISDDVSLLQKVLRPGGLHPKHPLRLNWEAPTPNSEIRFEFHHLADDIRATQDAPGFGSLRRQLTKNASDFQNFRYELRMAASFARSAGQRLLSLGGDHKGPDIELTAISKHKCGVACFRAADNPPSLGETSDMLNELAMSLLGPISTAPGESDVMLEMAFPSYPLSRDIFSEMHRLLPKAWKHPEYACVFGASGTSVVRHPYPDSVGTNRRRVRLRARVPVPVGEKKRLLEKITEKIRKEEEWASRYKGVPIFAMEASSFGMFLSAEDLREVIGDQSHSFATFIITKAFFNDNIDGTGRHLMERIEPAHRLQVGLNIGIETFGASIQSWSEAVSVKVDVA